MGTTKGGITFVVICLISTVLAAQKEELSESYRGSQRNNVEYQKVAPIKVFDNLYYVGPGFVSVWLMPTSQGLLLIDSAQEPYVDHVIDSIRKAGFDPKDVKYILITHGHVDHFGGAARIQELSGARVGALEEDWQLIEEAGKIPAAPNRPTVRHPFVDPESWRLWVKQVQEGAAKNLQQEKQKANKG